MKFFINSIALLCVSTLLQAQDIPEVLPPTINDSFAEGGDLTRAVQKRFDPNALAVPAGQMIDGRNWDDQEVADQYAKFTGLRVLLSSASQGLETRFFQRGPLTNREAASLLVKVMDMEGYVFVPSGSNEVKFLPKAAGGASNGAGELEGMIDNVGDIPPGDDYISYFMKFDYIKPDEAVRTFTQSLNGLDSGAKLAPVANASALIITGKSTFIRKLINQKEYIDVPAGNVENTWVEMKHADAEEVAATLNEIVNATQQSKTTAGVTNGGTARRANTPPIPGSNTAANASAGGANAAGETIPVQIVANPRLNKIFIMGRPVDLIFVEKLARDFDSPPTGTSRLERQLRFVTAAHIFDVAVQALEALDAARSSGAAGGPGGAGGGRSTGGGNTGGNNNGGNNRGNQQSGGGDSSVSQFDIDDAPQGQVIGKSFIVADNAANKIFVTGPPEGNKLVSDLIDQLDTRPQQVMISAVFGKVTLGKGQSTGFNLGFLSNGLAGGYNNSGLIDPGQISGVGSTRDADSNAVDLSLASVLAGGGLNVYGAYRNLTATLTALKTRSDFNVISSPVIYAANNQVGLLSSGQRIAVPSSTITSDAGSQNTNIEFRDVLLRLEVVPLVNSEDEVTLRISLLNEDIQGEQIIDGDSIPTIVTESIETTVTIPNGAAVVLGGLITEDEQSSKAGVPILSDIPGIGRLFSRKSNNVIREELLVFIQPTIVNNPAAQREVQAALEGRYDVSSPVHEFLDNGVLPSRSNEDNVSEVEPRNVDGRYEAKKKNRPQLGRGSQFRNPTRR